jgi:hypothetical protein
MPARLQIQIRATETLSCGCGPILVFTEMIIKLVRNEEHYDSIFDAAITRSVYVNFLIIYRNN